MAKKDSRCDFRVMGWKLVGKRLFLTKQTDFAGGPVGAEAVGEVEGGAGAGGDGGAWTKSTKGEQPRGLVEAEAGP